VLSEGSLGRKERAASGWEMVNVQACVNGLHVCEQVGVAIAARFIIRTPTMMDASETT
jgi:hypothetical protein